MHSQDGYPGDTSTTLLHTYQEFVERVDALGFMSLSPALAGLASLGIETNPTAWHTGDPVKDPWQWKDRAAAEKRLAYACCLGKAKGFIAPRLYPLFYAAFRPAQSIPERWEQGKLSQMTWRTWEQFEQRRSLNTSEIRAALGVAGKSGASQVEASLDGLQGEFYLTTAGVRQKVSKAGQFYGWPATVFERVDDWALPEWLAEARLWDPAGAFEAILDEGVAANPNLNRVLLAKFLNNRSI